jgi:hypothetical protein
MKKILAMLALAASTSVFAGDSITLERSGIDNVGSTRQTQYQMMYKHTFTNNLAGDLQFQNTTNDSTSALSTRIEGGVTVSEKVAGPIGVYFRTAAGQKFSNTTDFSYWSVEPGVTADVPGISGLTAKVGWRYRTAFDPTKNADQTHTMRYGLSYAVTKVDAVGVRYDRVNGDNDQKTIAVNYTRSF